MNNFDIEGLDDRNKEPEPQQGLEDFNVEDYQDHYDLTLELQGSPYLKEGLLKLKILNNDQQDSNVSEVAPPPSSAASTASGAGNGARGSSNNNHKQDANATSAAAAAAAAANAAASTHTGTNTSSLLPNKFNESFVVVSKVIKKHQQKIRKLKQKQIVQMLEEEEDEDGVMGDGNWLKNAANIGSYNLCSTYAQLEKINGNTTVSKKQPKKFIFEAGTKEIALEFINTCNFWASKITAIPTLEESISSIEYGWTNLDALIHRKDSFKKAKYIQKWEPLARGVYLRFGLQLRFDLEQQDREAAILDQLENDSTLKEEGKDINEEATKLFIAQYEQDSELTQLVKFEIRKLFTSMRDVSKVIPTFQSSRSINNLIELTKQQQHQYAYYPSYHPHQHPANNGSGEDDQNKGFSLVKSPKTFTLSNYNDNESPINQLLQTIDSNNHLHSGDKNDLMHSFSTNTIKEEEEPEESDDTKTANDYTISTKNNPSGETLQPSHVLK
ncbi:hypothetical protein QCA50_019908 [Cerrena zonata]|uniref:Uncharacterized protein n=1 Tax=Cerrena zonata TaxID=2478898 RepID=A0AAW0FKD6_9APHY